jgi:hypothetical protein
MPDSPRPDERVRCSAWADALGLPGDCDQARRTVNDAGRAKCQEPRVMTLRGISGLGHVGAADRPGDRGPAIPYLRAYCPGCRTERMVDLRTTDRHPIGAVTSLIPSPSCTMCRRHPPFEKILGLAKSGSEWRERV